jgi:histidinol-phosphate phosphatase family protein
MSHKAIFFDRDDTLIKDTGYMYKVEDLEFFKDTFEVLKSFQARGYLIFIVTNQSGIGRGLYTEEDMHIFNNNMLNALLKQGIKIQDLVFCPHAPGDECACRKPSPKLLNELCEKYDIDKSQSIMVGDKKSDVEAGNNAGLQTFRIKNNNLIKLITP